MAVIAKTITIPADEPARVPTLDPEPWRALEISFGVGQVIWIPSHTACIPFLPSGASVLPARMKNVSDIERSCGYLTDHRSTISLPTYDIVDKDNSFSNFISNKALNGIGSLNRVIREYEWDAGTPLPIQGANYRVFSKGTWLFQNHQSTEYATTVRINCADINRGLDTTIFEPMTWTIAEGFDTEATKIKTTINVAEFEADSTLFWRPFEHGAHYHYEPGRTGTYMRLESTGSDSQLKEIIWASDMYVEDDYVVIDIERGRLLTDAQSVSIDEGTTVENGPQLLEWIFIDETITTMFRMLTTNVSGARTLPTHWGANADSQWINGMALAIHSSALRLKFENLGKQTCKAFLEKEVLGAYPAVAPVNGQGQLTFTPIVIPTDSNAGQIVFDETNCVTDKSISLAHIKTLIHTEVEVKYNWDAQREQFNSTIKYRSPDSESFNGFVKTKTVELKGLHSGIHTPPQLQKLAGVLGDANYFELQEIEVESFINDIELGTLVSVQFGGKLVLDDAAGENDAALLNRTMTVTSAREVRATRTTKYTLHGTLQVAQDFYAGRKQHNLSVEEYKRGGIDLAPMISAGNITLEMGKKYYYVNDNNLGVGATVSGAVNVTVTGSGKYPEIWCFGFLDWTPDIDLTGRGGNPGGQGATVTTEATQGQPGYFGGRSSNVGLTASQLYSSFSSGSSDFGNQTTTYVRASKVDVGIVPNVRINRQGAASLPNLVLDANGGQLSGYPADLSGSAGPGGPLSLLSDANKDNSSPAQVISINGSNAGNGGGGILFVCWGMVMRGRIITSGTNAAPQNTATMNGQVFNGARGAPGDSGGVLCIIDGAHPRPVFNESNIIANIGDSTVPGNGARGITKTSGTPIRPYLIGTVSENLWATRHRIVYTPETALLQAQSSSVLDSFFVNQRDGRVRLYVGDVDPSNANLADMRITQTALDSNAADVDFRILTSSGWRDFVRGVDDFEYVYDALIAGKRKYNSLEIVASSTRPVGEPDGTIWYNPSNGTEWILYENQDDILIRENQAPQGEDLINDLSFARSLAGEKLWLFTRNENLAPNNTKSATATSGGSSGGGGSTSTQGITLTDQGRTVAGTAYQNDGGGVIEQGRQGTVTLDDTTQLTFTVGANGAFGVTFPSTNDNNLGKQASIYTQNAAAGTQAQLNFTYEL